MSGNDLQHIDWLGMHLQVPAVWEIVRHATNMRAGHLYFVDRRHQRLALYWTACESRPDSAVLLQSSRARDEQLHPGATFSAVPAAGPWRGHSWSDAQGQVCRMARYDSALGRWVELVFSWPDVRDSDFERRVMQSWAGTAAPGGLRRLRAFGVDVTAPEGWQLGTAEVVPAQVTLGYRAPRGAAEVRCTRLAHEWHHGDLPALAGRESRASGLVVSAARYAAHDACVARGRETPFAWRWVLGGRRRVASVVWHCPAADSVYRVRVESGRQVAAEPQQFEVRCCQVQEAA